MFNNVLTHSTSEQQHSTSIHDQVQIALAIADQAILKSLLTRSIPPIDTPQRIGHITSAIGVPVSPKKSVDGILHFEEMHCILASTQVNFGQSMTQKEYMRLTRCESEMQTLCQGVPLPHASMLLTQAGFTAQQANDILHLSYEANHKSWWYSLNAEGEPQNLFLRLIRTFRYPDGTYTLQYKDHFAQEKPSCFTHQEQQVLVEIRSNAHSFSKTLEKINHCRAQLRISKTIVICEEISELEAQGFMSQGISLFPATELLLPAQANCGICATRDCPMNGSANSPVLTCRRFCLDGCPN